GGRQRNQPSCLPAYLHLRPTVLIPSAPPGHVSLSAHQVVDDSVINRRVAASTLARYGAEVAPCNPVYLPTPPTLSTHQVVDDNLINRRVAASTLTRYGAEVALAESGEAALRLLQARHSFCLVLMDLHMPGLDGCVLVCSWTSTCWAWTGACSCAHGPPHAGPGRVRARVLMDLRMPALDGSVRS
ncbi:unnamed protein product, partial [Closterium sp. NIES-64]